MCGNQCLVSVSVCVWCGVQGCECGWVWVSMCEGECLCGGRVKVG